MGSSGSPWQWMAAFVGIAFAVTVATASLMVFRHLQLAGERPEFHMVVVWQAIIYAAWIPVAAFVWRVFGQSGLTRSEIKRFLIVGVIAIPIHAIGGTFVDIAFSVPGSADLVAMAAQRAQLDVLIYLSFGVLVIAAEFHRRAADEAAAAAAIKVAMARARTADDPTGPSSSDEAVLSVAVGTKKMVVRLNEIEWFGSAANYVVVNWQGREGLVRKTIRSLEHELDPLTFARIHRSTVVNLSKVRAAESLSDGSWRLQMESGTELVASRTYRSEILDRLKVR